MIHEQPEHVEVVPVQNNALELMERAAIDIQIATAHRFPRSISKFTERAKAMVAVDHETAESCIYRRPVGKDANGNQTYAEGESIRLAEIVAACYGNIRVSGMVTEMTETYVKSVGMAHDLETNYGAKAEVIESTVKKSYTKKDGTVVPGKPYDERMRVVVAKAAQSKAMRDAIFRVVPKSLCKSITNIARQVISGNERPLEERRQLVSQWLSKLSLDPKRVFAALGVCGIADLDNEKLELLTGIRTALKEGDITLDEAFPVVNFDDAQKQAKNNIGNQSGSEAVEAAFENENEDGAENTDPEEAETPGQPDKPSEPETKKRGRTAKPQTPNSDPAWA